MVYVTGKTGIPGREKKTVSDHLIKDFRITQMFFHTWRNNVVSGSQEVYPTSRISISPELKPRYKNNPYF